MPQALSPIIKISKYTLTDEVRQRSFIVMFVICAIFIFLVRGCYHGDYMVNGQELEAGKVVIMVSKITFHVIAFGVMFLAALLSMRLFRRDRDDGTQSSILSKPINRWQYVAGKILGLWVLLIIFMFILHGIVFVITSINLWKPIMNAGHKGITCTSEYNKVKMPNYKGRIGKVNVNRKGSQEQA